MTRKRFIKKCRELLTVCGYGGKAVRFVTSIRSDYYLASYTNLAMLLYVVDGWCKDDDRLIECMRTQLLHLEQPRRLSENMRKTELNSLYGVMASWQ